MINLERIKQMYENFGLSAAIKSAYIDIVALLGFMGYCLTLPFQFFWLLLRGRTKERLQIDYRLKLAKEKQQHLPKLSDKLYRAKAAEKNVTL